MNQVELNLKAKTQERTSAFGATSLKLGCCAFLLLWISGSMLIPAIHDEVSARAASWTAMVSFPIVIVVGFIAFGLGAASLLGYGRKRGTSRPFLGFFGMLTGLIYGPFLLLATCLTWIR